ncbi:PadR family transcriptional regulator [Fulvivirgaceae bacterium BMA10]|uniref:PadR family transcriptional regulator n=1 Tax=Splendidivirga corallicola TaxID=3051826 RepID=A0ABT8L1L2_9BACT|nr:PadR family transcriptional regulator [Fulvivirgaceae bacterium BMA10]
MTLLSRTEEMLLLMVCKLQDEAYGMQIRNEVKEVTGKLYSIGGIYVPLDRLVAKGFLKMEDVEASEDRMGRPRRRFTITAEGLSVLRETRQMELAMWDLPDTILKKMKLV